MPEVRRRLSFLLVAPRYLGDLVGSTWFLVCFIGTVFGIVGPFLPPLKSRLPVAVGLAIALVCWTAAPLVAYDLLVKQVEALEKRPPQPVRVGPSAHLTTTGNNSPINLTVYAALPEGFPYSELGPLVAGGIIDAIAEATAEGEVGPEGEAAAP